MAKRATKAPAKAEPGPFPQAFEGLDDWAKQVAKCINTRELDGLIASHRKLAADRRLLAAERRLARMQAEALERARPRRKKKPARTAG